MTPHRPRHLPVQPADAVGLGGQPQGEHGHAEIAVVVAGVGASEPEELLPGEAETLPVDVGAPYPGGYGAVRVGDLDGQGGPRGVGDRLDRKAVEVVLGIGLELPAVRVERLPEVPLAIQETDPGQWEAEVARRLQVVPGGHPEASRIDRQGSGDSEFQREIGNLQTVLTVRLVEPGLSRHVLLERGGQPGDAGGELAVCLGRGQAVLAQRG